MADELDRNQVLNDIDAYLKQCLSVIDQGPRSREMSLVKTKVEEAGMWLHRHRLKVLEDRQAEPIFSREVDPEDAEITNIRSLETLKDLKEYIHGKH